MTNDQKQFVEGRGYTKEDWAAVGSPEITDEELASTRPAKEVLPASFFEGLAEARRARGRPRKQDAKEAVTLRLEPQLIELFKARGPDWRSQMADILRESARKQGKMVGPEGLEPPTKRL